MPTRTPAFEDGPVFRTAQQAVAEHLRYEILSGVLEPGTRLRQADLAQRMRTSTTPVREALRQLVVEGLLDGDPHRRITVHEPNRQELEEIYEIRRQLEPICVERAVRHLGEDDLRALASAQEEMDAEEDPVRWSVLNREFHAAVAAASGSPLLTDIVDNLRDRSAIYVAMTLRADPSRRTVANRQHGELIRALRARNEVRAREVMVDHLIQTEDIGANSLEGGGVVA